MKAGHKEYRIFSNLNIKNESEYENKLEIWKKDKEDIEKRIDLYIFPLNLEKSINERFGLKFRNVSIKNGNFSVKRLELKIRSDRTIEGIEKWSKKIKEKVDPFNILTVINNSDNSDNKIIVKLNEISYSLNLIKVLETIKTILSSYNTNEIINYSKSFEKFPFGFVLTFKNRSDNSYEEDVMIKSFYFEVNEKNKEKLEAKLCFHRSLCVENEVNKTLRENLNNKLEDYTVAGYPQEFLNLFTKI